MFEKALRVVKRSDLVAVGDDFGVRVGTRFLSVQPDGTYETRTSVGAWETGRLVDGNKLVFSGTGIDWAVLVVDL